MTAPERNVAVIVTGTERAVVGVHSCAGRGNCLFWVLLLWMKRQGFAVINVRITEVRVLGGVCGRS